MKVSSRRPLILPLAALLVVAGCTSADDEVRRLQARATYEQAIRNLADKRVSLGLNNLREAVALDPENPVFRNALGVVLLDALGKPVEAQAEFQKAVELDPQYAEAHHNLGLALAAQGKAEEAIAQYRKALALPIYPTPEIGYYNMGNAYLHLGRLQEAEEAYRTAVQLAPKMAAPYYGLGMTLWRAGRKDEARAAFKAARDLGPGSPFGRAATDALKTIDDGG